MDVGLRDAAVEAVTMLVEMGFCCRETTALAVSAVESSVEI